MIVGNTASQMSSGAAGALCDRRCRGEVEHHEICLHPGREAPDPVVETKRTGRSGGREPEEFGRVECASAELRHLVCRGHRAEHRE
jgi:hypothetical protein